MSGFHGQTIDDKEVKLTLKLLQKGLGGVLLFAYNIEDPKQLKELTAALKKANPRVFIAVDQEGGKVQRLTSRNGFEDFPAPELKKTAEYQPMARVLAEHGFNVNFAPVVDLKNVKSPIGAHQRCFSDEPQSVVDYAKAFVEAHRQAGVLTSLKHFPGLGFARGDTHEGLVDITNTFQTQELLPFKQLVQTGHADMVMVGHVMNKNWDAHFPATLSATIIYKYLRQQAGFDGVVIADDLQMGAIQRFSLEERSLRALQAGCDILLFSNNPAASPVESFVPNPEIAIDVFNALDKAVSSKELSLESVEKAYRRVEKLRNSI